MGQTVQSIFESRRIGQTDLSVSRLGFGASALGNLYRPVTDEGARATVQTALGQGIRHFDTAPHYGLGLSERRIGDALRSSPRDDYVLSSKVGRLLVPASGIDVGTLRYGFATPMPFKAVFDYSGDAILRSVEDSLQRLGLARIDILFVHDIGRSTHGEDSKRHFRDLAQTGYRALEELRRIGAVRAIGLGSNETAACIEAMSIGKWDCFLLAGRYTLLEQDALDDFFPACAAHGANVIVGGPYNSGILATGVSAGGAVHFNYEPAPANIVARVARLEEICQAHRVELAAAALQFPYGHPLVASVIPGIDSVKQLAETIRLAQTEIPAAFWRDLKAQGLLRADAPTPSVNGGTTGVSPAPNAITLCPAEIRRDPGTANTNRQSQVTLMHPDDNVLICTRPIAAGDVIDWGEEQFRAASMVGVGHKIARRVIAEGHKVLRYGAPIGTATKTINPGDHVHLHNLKSDYIASHTIDATKLEAPERTS